MLQPIHQMIKQNQDILYVKEYYDLIILMMFVLHPTEPAVFKISAVEIFTLFTQKNQPARMKSYPVRIHP